MIRFQDVTDWMTGDASPEITAAIEAELRDPNSLVSRHLARMADPVKHERAKSDPLVASLLQPRPASLRFPRISPIPIAAAFVVGPRPDPTRSIMLRHGLGIAAAFLVGATLMFLATRPSRNPVGPNGDFLELHVDKSARPAAWTEIWAGNVSDDSPAKANVDRLRDASGPKVKAIIDDLRSKGRPDHEILTILQNAFDPKRP